MEGQLKEIMLSETKEMEEGGGKEIVNQPKEIRRSLPKEMEGEPKEIVDKPKKIGSQNKKDLEGELKEIVNLPKKIMRKPK
jgi:hypothetical protein